MTPLKLKQMVKRRQIQIKSLLVPLRNEKLHLVQVFKHLLVPDIIILAITVMPERRIVPNQAFVACLILAIHVSWIPSFKVLHQNSISIVLHIIIFQIFDYMKINIDFTSSNLLSFFFIQGLSNTPPIMEYFANENYVEDINEDNPLSMKGEIGKKNIDIKWSM